MPHLTFDYSPALATHVDMDSFCIGMRDALLASGLFRPGGIRVRGHAANVQCVADGAPDRLFLDMVLRIGEGRNATEHAACLDQVYAAARALIEPRLAGRPFALSLELREIPAARSRKAWNSLHRAVE